MKKFTLIELIVVIAILGILTSIVIPNVSNQKEKAIASAIKSNIRSLQTSMELFRYDNEDAFPTKAEPTLFIPQAIDFDQLYPKYIKHKPKIYMHEKYWVDVFGRVWGSTVDAPSSIYYRDGTSGELISWKHVSDSYSYDVYNVNEPRAMGKLNKIKMKELQPVVLQGDLTTYDGRIVNYPINSNPAEAYLVNAVDKFGLQTAPVGAGYEGFPLESGNNPQSGSNDGILMPIHDLGSYTFITNAHGTAVWDGISKSETKPAGTNITYQYFTSNDGTSYTQQPSEDVTTFPNAQYLKVIVTLSGDETNKPTLSKLKVAFHLLVDEIVEADMDNPSKMENTKKNPDGSIGLEDGKKEGKVTNVMPLPNAPALSSVKEVSPVTNTPAGSSAAPLYSTSPDGGNTWSKPTPFPEELPPGNALKTEMDLKRDDPSKPSPTLNGITAQTTPPVQPKPPITPAEENKDEEEELWETIDTMQFEVDSVTEGDWLSATISDLQPTDSRIVYEYSTEKSAKVDNISKVPNSRYLYVDITRQKKKGKNVEPKFFGVEVDYKLQDGTVKKTTLLGDIRKDIQNAVDLYKATEGKAPTDVQPSKVSSQPINFDSLVPTYLKYRPQGIAGTKYHIDFLGNIWISTLNKTSNIAAQDGTISWNAIAGATKYNVYESQSGGSGAGAANQALTGFTYLGETANPVYTGVVGHEYMITGVNEQGIEGLPSSVVKMTESTPPPTNISLSSSNVTAISITLNMSATGADSFDIYRNNILWKNVSGTTTTVVDSGLTTNTNYSYYIVAKNSVGEKQSNSISVTTASIPKPTGVTLSYTGLTSNSVTLNFAATGADTIDIYRNNAFLKTVIGTATSTSDTGLAQNTTYEYYIVAKNESGTTQSSTISVTTATSAPTNTQFSIGQTTPYTIELLFSADNATSIEVWSNNGYITSLPGTATSYVRHNLAPGGMEQYHLVFKNGSLSTTSSYLTAYSQNISYQFTFTIGGYTSNSITLNLNATQAEYFDVYRNGSLIKTLPASTTTWTDTGLSANTLYTYQLKATPIGNSLTSTTRQQRTNS